MNLGSYIVHICSKQQLALHIMRKAKCEPRPLPPPYLVLKNHGQLCHDFYPCIILPKMYNTCHAIAGSSAVNTIGEMALNHAISSPFFPLFLMDYKYIICRYVPIHLHIAKNATWNHVWADKHFCSGGVHKLREQDLGQFLHPPPLVNGHEHFDDPP